MQDQMQSEIAELNGEIADLDDPRQGYAVVQQRIHTYRAAGTRVPDELVQIERRLMRECMAESQGR